MLPECGIGFVRESGGDNSFHASFSRRVSKFSRINAVTRNDSESFRDVHREKVSNLSAREKKNSGCSDAYAKHRILKQALAAASASTASSLPVMAAALDVQLGERFLQRGLNSRDFLGRVIFFHRHFGPLNRGFGGGGIDFFGLQRHVGKYRN